MTRTRALIIVGIAAVLTIALWWRHQHRSGVSPGAPAAVAATSPARAATPAARTAVHVTVAVRDDTGAIAATVRLAHAGEVTLATAGEKIEIEPGDWTISASAPGHEPAAITRDITSDTEIDLVLAKGGRTLAGTVTDASGGPIAGARVDASKLSALARPDDAVASVITNADGRYRMTVPEGTLLVAASDPDYAPQARYVEVGTTGATADFALVPGGVVEGVVRDEHSHEPIAGAQVIAARDAAAMFGEARRHHATAGADGRFRITGLGPGAYELRAVAGARRTKAPTVVGLGVAEQVSDVEILVGEGAVVRGRAIDEGGAPAAGVEVSPFGGDQASATTDAKGGFVLEGLDAGRYQLVGNGNGYVSAGATAVELVDKDVGDVTVRVRHGVVVEGHVEPRQVCDVRLDFDDATLGPREMPMLIAPVTTGPDGEFALPSASPVPYVLAARCPSGDQGSLPVTLAPGMPPVILAVKPGASIAGKVVDGHGTPVAGATVMAAPRAGTERTVIVNGMVTSGSQVLTNAAGEYTLTGLAAMTYHLAVLDRGRPLPMKTDATIALGAGEHKTGVALEVERPDGVIRGTVVGADGAPIADAWVSVHQSIDDLIGDVDKDSQGRMVMVESTDDGGGAGDLPPALTDGTGHFEIGGLPRSSWTVVAEAEHGAVRGRMTKVTPDATITIQAGGVTALRGVVHGARGVFTVELDGPTRAQRSFASADGTFSISRVDPGAYTVRVTSGAGNGEAEVQIVAGKPASVEITLAANAVVTGTVVDASGTPAGGVPVVIVPDAADGRIQISVAGPPPTTRPDGSFRVEAKAGASALALLVQPRPLIKRGLSLIAGQTFDAGTVRLEPGK